MELKGKVAVVTGASVSVGREFALEFARQGANVVCVARREEKLKETVELIKAESGHAIHVVADVTDLDQVNDLLAETLKTYGQVDILVNNAGVLSAVGASWEMDPQDWWRNVEVNLFGVFLCSRTFLPHMIERDTGLIINMDGGGGTPGPFVGGSAYGCSKAAILRFTESLAGELERAGSKVMAVCINPGFVRSELSERSVDTPYKAKWLPQVVDRLENDLGVPPDQCAKTAVKLLNILAPELNGRIFKNGTNFQKVSENLTRIKEENLLVLKYDQLD
jgi:NAD(P)-dependent dehydrogenase (short-subunit alcohol dehydrogenase family)